MSGDQTRIVRAIFGSHPTWFGKDAFVGLVEQQMPGSLR
jgi:hypothetical protein